MGYPYVYKPNGVMGRGGSERPPRYLCCAVPPTNSGESCPGYKSQFCKNPPCVDYKQLDEGTCVAHPDGWVDSRKRTCADYAASKLCNVDGTAGSGWLAGDGPFSHWATNGIDAGQACCECGGGTLARQQRANVYCPVREDDSRTLYNSSMNVPPHAPL